MKVFVAKNLNVRVGAPSVNAPCYNYLAQGSTIEVEEKLVKGDIYDGNNLWYKGLDGSYYWSGGIKENKPMDIDQSKSQNSYFSINPKLINWNLNIPQIPLEWKESKGKGTKIAILDTGIYEIHEDLIDAITFNEDFTPVKDKIDYDGHGTHVAGIIGSRSNKSNGVIGVAPESELIILKVLHDGKDGSMNNYQNIIDALDRALSLDVDIISLSFSLRLGKNPDEDDLLKVSALKEKIAEIGRKNIILVGAAGDNADLDDKQIFFPSICNEVISVAAINNGYFTRHPNYNTKLNIVGSYIDYLSTFKAPFFYKSQFGCSMTTAFISGIIALAISSKRKTIPNERFPKSNILSLLNTYSISLVNVDYSDNNKFFFFINNQTGG